MKRTLGFTLIGFAYGSILLLSAIVCAGAGHGTYLPLAVYGAPLSLLVPCTFIAPPFLWALFGYLLCKAGRWRAILFLLLHLVGIFAALSIGGLGGGFWERWGFTDAKTFDKTALWGGLGFYAAGQVAAWVMALRMAARERS